MNKCLRNGGRKGQGEGGGEGKRKGSLNAEFNLYCGSFGYLWEGSMHLRFREVSIQFPAPPLPRCDLGNLLHLSWLQSSHTYAAENNTYSKGC